MFTFRKVRRELNFEQGAAEYTYGQLDLYMQGSPAEIQTTTRCSLIGSSMTAGTPVLSPSSLLLPPLSHCKENFGVCLNIFFYFLKAR
jgi:hypothetical protein